MAGFWNPTLVPGRHMEIGLSAQSPRPQLLFMGISFVYVHDKLSYLKINGFLLVLVSNSLQDKQCEGCTSLAELESYGHRGPVHVVCLVFLTCLAREVGPVPLGSRAPCNSVLFIQSAHVPLHWAWAWTVLYSPDTLFEPVLLHDPYSLKMASKTPG